MYTIPEYVYEVFVYKASHPEAPDLTVAEAMLINENPDKRTHEMDREMREFRGRYYEELVDMYQGSANKDEFLAKANPLYEQYAADIAAYEQSKEEAEKEEEATEG